MCNNGYDFEFNPPMMYFCNSGQWQFYVPILYSYPQQLPWPDCSSKLISLLIITVSKGRLTPRPHVSGYFWICNHRTNLPPLSCAVWRMLWTHFIAEVPWVLEWIRIPSDVCGEANSISIRYVWAGKSFLIQKAKVADLRLSGYVWMGPKQ